MYNTLEVLTKSHTEFGVSREFQGFSRWVWATNPQVPMQKMLDQYNEKFRTNLETEEVMNSIDILVGE